jgi:hypothetical protein
MADDVVEKHLLAGLDERERGFSRAVDIERREGVFRAVFRYETLVLESAAASAAAALAELMRLLHERDYRQLRTRLTFLGGAYLGSQELWIECPDPERPPEAVGGLSGLVHRIWQALTRRW